MNAWSLSDWADHLAALGSSGATDPTRLDAAPDAFTAWRAHRAGSAERTPENPRGIDDLLWAALLEESLDQDRLSIALALPPGGDGPTPAAPLHEQQDTESLEVWTERELSALHALLWLTIRHPHQRWRERLHTCARWHLEYTQPDNATNRPWAAHLFLVLAHEDDDADARLYAETLVHNCMVSMGRPDALSAEILADASEALRAAAQRASH